MPFFFQKNKKLGGFANETCSETGLFHRGPPHLGL